MLGSKNKRKRTNQIDTLIGHNTKMLGDLHFSGGLHVDGIVNGNVVAVDESSSVLTLSEKGSIEGEVRVPHVVINGQIIGDVHASEHVELASEARVTGNVYYGLIEMAMGAEVNGKLVHESEKNPPLQLSHAPEEVPVEQS